MKIDFTKPLLTIKGEPLKMGAEDNAPTLTLQEAATTGLFAPLPGDKGSPQQAAEAFRLALRISNDAACCEISAAESTLIKEGVGRAFGNQPAVSGPVDMLLEGGAIVTEKPAKEK
jgi:hypothetical protein